MSLKILPPANSQERLARQRGLGALRQQGREVRAFAQFFWTMSRGLDYQDAALKDIFNLCLDNPLPQWEMEQIRILDFWDFSNYVHHRKDWQILSPPESTCPDQPTVPPSSNQEQVPLLPPTLKRRLRRKRAARNAVAITMSAESTAVTAEVGKSTPLFPELVENATVTSESVGSVPVIPKPANPEAVKSAPVLPELVESTVVIPESVKSSLAIPKSVKSAPVLLEIHFESTSVLAPGPVFIPEQPCKQRKKGCVLQSTVFPAAPEGTPESAPESVPAAPEGISVAPEGAPESAPEPIPAAPKGISAAPEGAPESVFEPIPAALRGIPVSVLERFQDLVLIQEAVPVSLDTTIEAIPESSTLPLKPTENISEQSFCLVTKVTVSEPPVLPRETIPVSHIVPTELVLDSRVMPTESSPASRTMPTEIIPELLVLPVMASEATLKQPPVTVLSMDDTEAIPEQPALTATGSESAPVLESVPESFLDFVSESALVPVQEPVPEDPVPAAPEDSSAVPVGRQRSLSVIQESFPEAVPVAMEDSSATPRGSQESVPESIPVAQEGIFTAPKGLPESIFELGPEAPKGIPVLAPEPTPDSASATEVVPVSFVTSLEANPKDLVSHVKPTENNPVLCCTLGNCPGSGQGGPSREP